MVTYDESFSCILERAKERQDDALTVLYHLYHPRIFNYIYNDITNYAITEDLTSEVFLIMVERIHKVRATDEIAFHAWLNTIARTRIMRYYRKHSKCPSVSLYHSPEAASLHSSVDPVQYAEMRERANMITQEMAALPHEQQQILMGRVILGHSAQMVADHLNKDAATIRVIQHRALRRLQKKLSACIMIVLVVLGTIFGFGYKLVSAAHPGSPLYPIKQRARQIWHPSNSPRPHMHKTVTPIATKQSNTKGNGSPTITPSSTTVVKETMADPTSTPKPILDIHASLTILPTATPTICFVGICP